MRLGNLPYNSEGRYFDEVESVVHHDTAPPFYGIVAAILIAMTLLAGLWAVRAWRR